MRFRYDKSSKWLIQHHADAILRLGGAVDIESWKALQAELVQPRQLPDGLVEVHFRNRVASDLFLIELSTYPDNRVSAQLLDDLLLTYLDRRVLPEVLTIVLHPKGNVQVAQAASLDSPLGWSRLQANWRVVELWTLSAEVLLSAEDPGLVPWVPLTRFEQPPEVVFRRCRQIIDEKAPGEEHENLLVVTQVLAGLRYNDPELFKVLGGREAMIESFAIQDAIAAVEARRAQKSIIAFLHARFGTVPDSLVAAVKTVTDEARLDELTKAAATSPSLADFAQHLPK